MPPSPVDLTPAAPGRRRSTPQPGLQLRMASRLLSALSRRRSFVTLMFHRVHAAPDPWRPDEPHAELFEQQLQVLMSQFDVLPLQEALQRLDSGSLARPAVAITFDDGYADNYHVALPLLLKLGAPATFFISSGYLDGGVMWNDRVIEALRNVPSGRLDLAEIGLPPVTIGDARSRLAACRQVIENLKYREPAERAAAAQTVVRLCGAHMPPNLMLSGSQVAALARNGMEIGGHTVSHPILTRLERAGWVESRWENVDPSEEGRPRRRYYRLSSAGAVQAPQAIARTISRRGALSYVLRPDLNGGAST